MDSERTCLIIVRIKDDVVGLIVDGVDTAREIQGCPPTKTGSINSSHVSGPGNINHQDKIMLDLERFAQDAKLESLDTAGL